MMRYLGLDLGTKTLGVAISDKTNTLAVPLKLISRILTLKLMSDLLVFRKIQLMKKTFLTLMIKTPALCHFLSYFLLSLTFHPLKLLIK